MLKNGCLQLGDLVEEAGGTEGVNELKGLYFLMAIMSVKTCLRVSAIKVLMAESRRHVLRK